MTTRVWAGVLVLAACGAPEDELGVEATDDGYGLRWGSQDDPSILSAELKYKLQELPQQGEVGTPPWAGSYWPVYEDSINYKWDGAASDSPAVKYGKAFNVANIEDTVSQANGIDHYATRTACTDDSACKADLGETCAKRTGKTSGVCIPSWWGVCHAWSPASIMEPEPVRPVTRNGVTFKVNDLKALMTLAYDKTSSRFVSLRCFDDDGQNQITYDEFGRPKGQDVACQDTNPGTFHVVLTNFIGLRGQSFVEDRVFDDEVWNQPMRGYRVLEQREVSAQEANSLVGVTATGATTVERSGDLAQGAWSHLGSFATSSGKVVKVTMTGTGDADLYVRFGAQATAQLFDCRPYVGGSAETCEVTTPAGQTSVFVSVQGYTAAKFAATVSVGGAVPSAYAFNPDAKKLFYVRTEARYIGEASAATDGNLRAAIDQYTHTDRYEYVLELDADGKIIGGEWVGSSKKAHPDFLWVPTGRQSETTGGGAIKYADVKSLLDESVRVVGGTPIVVEKSGTLAQAAWQHYGPYDAGAGAITVTMSGTGDADLYVRTGAQPTASAFTCRPYQSGSSETCTLTGPHLFYVSVQGYAASSTYALRITFTPKTAAPSATTHLSVTGTVAQGQSLPFSLNVTAGKPIVVKLVGTSDVDLYVRQGSAPTTSSYDVAGTTSSATEELRVTPVASGVLHIVVYGYTASPFTLTTSDG